MKTSPLLLNDMTVGQLAAMLARALLVLGVDSGPLHLAVAQSTPTLQLFGPTDERIFGPWGDPEHHIVIKATQKCPGCPAIPCGQLDFGPEEVSQHPCVRFIPEKQVEQALTVLIAQYPDWQYPASGSEKVSSQTGSSVRNSAHTDTEEVN
jgi:ADP-heptose:LPS heptosyltransferase